ncbi:MAG TPA: NAD(P)H-binding protein, partial [Oculatellaceae cyanobacterium]
MDILTNNLTVFVSDPEYAPAKQFFQALESSGHYNVRGLNRSNTTIASTTPGTLEWSSANITNTEAVKDFVQGCEAAVMFVMPADLSEVKQLTRSFLEIASETGIQRLAWVAPACPEASDLGKHLAEAQALVRSQTLETLVLRHAPLFSDLLDQKKELKYRRTLSLPLGNSALPWLA